jgi:uncharacterized coiled-coil protein SlyX
MNKQRLKELKKIIPELSGVIEQLQFIAEQEQEAFDYMPESLQGYERGQTLENNIGFLEDSISTLEEVLEGINDHFEL